MFGVCMSGSNQNADEKKVNERTMITLRLPMRLYADVKEDVELVGDFGSVSAWIQQAIREFYASRTELRNRRRERCSRPNLLPSSSHLVPFPADAGGVDTIVPFRTEYATEDREDGAVLHGITKEDDGCRPRSSTVRDCIQRDSARRNLAFIHPCGRLTYKVYDVSGRKSVIPVLYHQSVGGYAGAPGSSVLVLPDQPEHDLLAFGCELDRDLWIECIGPLG